MDTTDYLKNIMAQYVMSNLKIPEKDFLDRMLDLQQQGAFIEGFSDEEVNVQRDKTLNFEWGHNHDFGQFKMSGAMGDRHISIMRTFIDVFGLPLDLTGKSVLDVGVWTGGTTLLLAGMGAEPLLGIEEVAKYSNAAYFLLNCFFERDKKVSVLNRSLYKFTENIQYYERFDIVIFAGVLYHLTDPLLGLRTLFNMLKDGGEIYVETMTTDIGEGKAAIEYYGAQVAGWNWFAPNSLALRRMLKDVGFVPSEVEIKERNRLFVKAKREKWQPMLKAGISNGNTK